MGEVRVSAPRWPTREEWQSEPFYFDQWEIDQRWANIAEPCEIEDLVESLREEGRRLNRAIKLLRSGLVPLGRIDGGALPALQPLQRRLEEMDARAREAAAARQVEHRSTELAWKQELARRARIERMGAP